jgi:hypothetical protein
MKNILSLPKSALENAMHACMVYAIILNFFAVRLPPIQPMLVGVCSLEFSIKASA